MIKEAVINYCRIYEARACRVPGGGYFFFLKLLVVTGCVGSFNFRECKKRL